MTKTNPREATAVRTKTLGGIGQVPVIELWAFDSPEANGRKPLVGEVSYAFDIPLVDEGAVARIHVSVEGIRAIAEHFAQFLAEEDL